MADINVGAISEALNNKADVDLHNLNNEGKKSVTLAGMVMAFAGTTAPTGWLKCDGSTISRTTYSALFNVIGTTYCAGDGSTTFKLPTQSVLPLGTSAPVKTNKNNKQLQVMYGTLRLGITDGVTTSLLIPYNNNADNDYLKFESNGTAGYANVFADVANATGAKAIVCIKY